jgi:hypothetical protein
MLGYLLGSQGVAMAGLVARYTLLAICLPAFIAIASHAWCAWRRSTREAAAASAALVVTSPIAAPPGES